MLRVKYEEVVGVRRDCPYGLSDTSLGEVIISFLDILKIIFLDIDGVMNSTYNTFQFRKNNSPEADRYGTVFDPKCVENLRKIIEATGADIVISSSRKKNLTYQQILQFWRDRNLPGFVTDVTPNISKDRGDEIEAWLKQCREEVQYSIIDDLDASNFYSSHESHLVVVDNYHGLDDDAAQKAIHILKEQKLSQ